MIIYVLLCVFFHISLLQFFWWQVCPFASCYKPILHYTVNVTGSFFFLFEKKKNISVDSKQQAAYKTFSLFSHSRYSSLFGCHIALEPVMLAVFWMGQLLPHSAHTHKFIFSKNDKNETENGEETNKKQTNRMWRPEKCTVWNKVRSYALALFDR